MQGLLVYLAVYIVTDRHMVLIFFYVHSIWCICFRSMLETAYFQT